MIKEEKEVLKEIIGDLERLTVAVVELQALAKQKSVSASREVAVPKITGDYDKLRKKIDALP